MNQYDKQHKKNLTQYEQQIVQLMEEAQQQVAQMVTLWAHDLKDDTPFRWADYPVAKQRMQTVLEQLNEDMHTAIENGITQEWQLSNQKNDHFTQSAFGEYLGQLPEERRAQYLNNNQEALEAFKQRKVNGLNLSSRVWNITREYQDEVEMAIDTAIRDGLPVTTLAQHFKQYLRNPDALFRRVRNRWGELELSKHARAYHPGQGVYRSAYKNARRTAATEINIAYRTSDYDRWQQMDFVVGIEIEPSHTNHPDYDLCDTLAGQYPKGFKFTGWHPHCRCIATPILKTKEEMQQDTELIIQGEEPERGSENEVTTVPENFHKWLEQNQQRLRRNTLPYFLKDNGQVDNKGVYKIRDFTNANNGTALNAAATTGLPDTIRLRRKQIMQIAKQQVKNSVMHHPVFEKPVTITGKAIKEWVNQPFGEYEAKNEALLQLPVLLQQSEYVGHGVDKHRHDYKMHLFHINVNSLPAWIIIRENERGECFLHSITDNKTILTHIIP